MFILEKSSKIIMHNYNNFEVKFRFTRFKFDTILYRVDNKCTQEPDYYHFFTIIIENIFS